MKKGLKIALIVLEVIFIVLTLLGAAAAFGTIIDINAEHDFIDNLDCGFYYMFAYGFLRLAIIASVQFFMLAASLHAFRKSFKAETKRPALPSTIALISSVTAILIFYLPFCLAVITRLIGRHWNYISYVYYASMAICAIICISSLIATVAINIKNKRRLKAAAVQGIPADEADQPLS